VLKAFAKNKYGTVDNINTHRKFKNDWKSL
jgi:hypothetical protein